MTNLEKSKRAIAKAKNADEYIKICSVEHIMSVSSANLEIK